MASGNPVRARLKGDELSALDAFRRQKENPPSRGAAVRELVRRSLLDMRRGEVIAARHAGEAA